MALLVVTAPLGGPQNFTAETINSTSIHLSWNRPSTPNGVITHYSLVHNINTDGGPSPDPNLINATMFTVKDLNSDTEYVFSIAAATSAGLGPFIETSVRTAEEGMCEHTYTHTEGLRAT